MRRSILRFTGFLCSLGLGSAGCVVGIELVDEGETDSADTAGSTGGPDSTAECTASSATSDAGECGWVEGAYFLGEIGQPNTGPNTLDLYADGTYDMMSFECDYGIGAAGTWSVEGDSVVLSADEGLAWFFEEALTSLRLSLGADCNELVADLVTASGGSRQETLQRGTACLSHACAPTDGPDLGPSILEYCDVPPPTCE